MKPKAIDLTDRAARKEQCPYGRSIMCGSTECLNCKFNRINPATSQYVIASFCVGDPESVAKHDRHMKLVRKALEKLQEKEQ
jgi:hypothetical protein